MQTRGHEPTIECECDFDHASDACSRLSVSDVRLDRSDRTRIPASLTRHQASDGLDLHRVPSECSSSVCFHVHHFVRAHTGALERRAHDVFLAAATGRNDKAATALTVVVHRAAANHGVNGIVIGESAGQSLEHHNPGALAANISVSRRIAELAAAVRREHAGIGIHERDLRAQDRVRATRERDRALARQKALASQVDRDQRRQSKPYRDVQVRTAQIQKVRETPRSAVPPGANGRMEVHLR